MAIKSLRDKITTLSGHGKKIPKKNPPKPKKQIDEADSLLKRDYNNVNIFEKYPNYTKLHVEDLVMEENVEDEQAEQNLGIILDSIKFLNGLQFEASRVNKERLSRKFNHNFPQLVVVDQLYCILPNSGSETFIDHNIQRLITLQKIKLIDLNNENFRFRLIILNGDFMKVVKDSIDNQQIQKDFVRLIHDYPNMLQIDGMLLSEYNLDATNLIHLGFLTISRERGIGSKAVYNLSLPNLGPFLKIMNVGIRFVGKVCQMYRQDQVLEKHLMEKYNQDTLVYRRMRGLNLTWLISVMVGCGLLECFNTPVGRVYRVTGKRM